MSFKRGQASVWIFLLLLLVPFVGFSKTYHLLNEKFLVAAAGDGADSGDDAVDPFSDYSEFEEETDEEADINFFKNGRLLTVGMLGGTRNFIGQMANSYNPSATFGVYLSYFFDLRFALQFSFLTGDHEFILVSPTSALTGNASLTSTNFDLKYYFNTQNVTKGLANLNPYLILGFGNYTRTRTLPPTVVEGFARDTSLAYNLGAGIEIPMLRNKMYFGIQGTFHYIAFKDQNTDMILNDAAGNPVNYGHQPGHIYDVLGIIGVNF